MDTNNPALANDGSRNAFAADSWLIRSFLLIAVVVMPLCIAWFSLRMAINERFNARIELIKKNVVAQAASLPRVAQPGYQLKMLRQDLVRRGIIRWSDARIRNLFDQFEKRYPGAFRWVFWDSRGTIRDLKHPAALGGKKMWQGFVGAIFNGREMIEPRFERSTNENNFAVVAAKRQLEQYLGLGLPLFRLTTNARDEVMPCNWLRRSSFITWDVEPVNFQPNGFPKRINGGFLLLVHRDKLPLEFGQSRTVLSRRKFGQQRLMPFPIMMFPAGDRGKVLVDPLLPKNPLFVRTVRHAYRVRDSQTINLPGWVAMTAPTDGNLSQRLVVLADLRKLVASREEQLLSSARLLVILFFLGWGLIQWFQWGGTQSISLRWRITGLFLIAILVPVTSLLGFGGWMLNREETRMRENAIDRMRQGMEGLDLRFRDAPKVLEREVFNQLQRVTVGVQTVPQLLTSLDQLAHEDEISYYYLSTPGGQLDRTNMAKMDEFIKRAIVESFKTKLEELNKSKVERTVLEGAVQEEMKAFVGQSGESSVIAETGSLRYFCYHDFHLYFLGTVVNLGSETRVLIVQLDAGLVEKKFVAQEFRENVQATAKPADHSRLSGENRGVVSEVGFFSRIRKGAHFPEDAEHWTLLKTAFNRSYELRSTMLGEVRIGNEEFLYFISPLQSMPMQSYVPCYLTSMRPIQTRVAELRRDLVSAASVASLVAVVLGLILAASLLGPINRIDGAVQLVGAGDLEVHLPETGGDELARLSRNINTMVMGLRERERMQVYVSDTVLEAVRDKDAKRSRDGDNVETTILFTDIRNFTRHAEMFPPKVMFAMLNSFFGGVEPIIRDFGGRVDKYIGDAAMCVFLSGSEDGQVDTSKLGHAERAVLAGIAVMAFLKRFNAERVSQGLFPIAIGIGINTGEVLLGDVGSERRKDLTVIGDVVNLASRLESASKQGKHTKIVLSESTWNKAGHLVEVEEMAQHEVAGKSQAVRMFEVIGPVPISLTF